MLQLDSSKPPLCSPSLKNCLNALSDSLSSFPCLSQTHLSTHSKSGFCLPTQWKLPTSGLPVITPNGQFSFFSYFTSQQYFTQFFFRKCFPCSLPTSLMATSRPHFLAPPSYLTIKCWWPQSLDLCPVHFSLDTVSISDLIQICISCSSLSTCVCEWLFQLCVSLISSSHLIWFKVKLGFP